MIEYLKKSGKADAIKILKFQERCLTSKCYNSKCYEYYKYLFIFIILNNQAAVAINIFL